MTVDGWLSRDDTKAGGDGKDDPRHEIPVFNMTVDSFVEHYGKSLLPKVGAVEEAEVEVG
jgi:hypothetical protein